MCIVQVFYVAGGKLESAKFCFIKDSCTPWPSCHLVKLKSIFYRKHLVEKCIKEFLDKILASKTVVSTSS